jgi:hypothetical protein
MKALRVCLTFLIFAAAGGAEAHGPSLKIDETSLAPGGTLTVRGEGLASNGEIQLTLRGILRDYSLGSVEGDEHGRFETRLTLPGDLEPGAYTLVAAGDRKATAKLTVTKPEGSAGVESSEPAPTHVHEPAQGGEIEAMQHAAAEPMAVERSTRGAARALAWGATLASALLGVALWLQERGRRS